MIYETILCSVRNRVATVMINRPDKLNALNSVAKRELRSMFESLRSDGEVDVVILTGAGEKSFVAGTDIAELAVLDRQTGREFAAGGQEVFERIEHLGKPVIAAVNGFALGGGCELALACHIRLASEKARFGQPEVSLGVIPGYGGTQRLARLVGKGRAMEMILTGVQVDAAEALRIGLVNRVFPPQELLPRAQAMAELIASMGQRAIHHALEAVNASDGPSVKEGFDREADLFGASCDTEDSREGIKAFLEKRKPVFRNR
jgi:enoyl-CoA hydratase